MWPSQRVHTAGKGTLSSPGPACRSGRGHAEFMKHVKRQSPSAIAGAGLCTAFLTKEQLQGGDEQHPLWALSGSKQAKQAKMEPAGRNGMSAPQRVVANHEHQDSVLRSASCFIPILLHMLLENVSLSERNAGMKLPLFPSPCSPARGPFKQQATVEKCPLQPFSYAHRHCRLPGLSMGLVTFQPQRTGPADTGRLRVPSCCRGSVKCYR